METKTICAALAAICMATALPSYAADRTISAYYALSADETVDGVLTVASGVTVDLNGHNLTVGGLAGDGTITAGAQDLTSPDPDHERVYSPTTFSGTNPTTEAINLFNNNYVRGGNTERVLVAKKDLPLAVTYDFGAGTPQKVDMYKVYVGPLGSYNNRGPKTWTFEGTDDTNGTWTVLHSQDNETWPTTQETRTYTFENNTAYRYYRISFTASSDGSWLELVQLEYFDSSAVPEIPPELRVNVPAGATTTNSTVAISGNIRLVKQGEGTFVAARANQTYSGGNHVAAGTIKPTSQNVDLLFGANGSDIKVDSYAAFDINGNSRCSLYHYVMNGGTAMNGGNAIGGNYAQLGDMTLTADSYVDSVGFLKSGAVPLTIDLGGNVLEVTPNKPTHIKKADITNGTLRILRGVSDNNAVYLYSLNARTATLELESHTGLYDDAMSVSNLILRSGFTTHGGATAIRGYRVYGTFKTETGNFPYVLMMDGSTFDLKSWNGVFNYLSTSTNPGRLQLLYDDGATVTIDIAGRSFNVGDCIIAWEKIPQNVMFQFDATTAAGGVQPVATERGLFYGYIADTVEQAWWTGNAGDDDVSNSGNWLCKNAVGDTVTGATALPSAVTHVYLEGSLNINVPTSSDLACRICTLTNATLAGDCDLRGFGTNLQVAANAEIDLNGHKLYARSAAFTGVCTVKGKAIDHPDDLTVNDASRVSSPTTFHASDIKAANLFNNTYEGGNNSKRVLIAKAYWPMVVTYDFGEGTVVDAYRLWTGNVTDVRKPGRWRFEGSSDGDSWTLLDSRWAETEWPSANAYRTYTFANETAYRYYRFTVENNCGGADGYGTFIEFIQLEYFHLKATQGELHLNTVSGESTELNNMSLTGNLRLFTEGAGKLWLGKTGQTYIGGTEICGGSVVGGSGQTDLLNKDVFGAKGSEVVVHGNNMATVNASNALLSLLSKYGYTGYKYVLDGGTISDPGDGIITELRLTANSRMETTSGLPTPGIAFFGWSGDKHAAYADLGGHELSVNIAGTKHFAFANATLENGSVYTGTQNGTFMTTNSVVATNNVSFRLNSNANNISGTFIVLDCTQIRSFENYNFGAYDIDVFGTFTPSTQGYFHGTTLHDGSMIDLSGLTITTLNVVAPYNASSANAQGAKTLHFESGATIGVKLGGRKVPRNTPVISWTAATAPDATVKFIRADEGRRLNFIKKEDGLYVLSGMIIIVK